MICLVRTGRGPVGSAAGFPRLLNPSSWHWACRGKVVMFHSTESWALARYLSDKGKGVVLVPHGIRERTRSELGFNDLCGPLPTQHSL